MPQQGLTLTIQPKGLKDLQREVQRLGEAGRRASLRGRFIGASIVAGTAKIRAPRDTGQLRQTIHAEKDEGGPVSRLVSLFDPFATRDEVAVVADTVYATRQEFEHEGRKERRRGKTIIKADPTSRKHYLGGSAHDHAGDIVAAVARELRRETGAR